MSAANVVRATRENTPMKPHSPRRFTRADRGPLLARPTWVPPNNIHSNTTLIDGSMALLLLSLLRFRATRDGAAGALAGHSRVLHRCGRERLPGCEQCDHRVHRREEAA